MKWPGYGTARTAHRARVTVWRPSVSTDPTNNSSTRWNVRGVNAIEKRESTASTAPGSDST